MEDIIRTNELIDKEHLTMDEAEELYQLAFEGHSSDVVMCDGCIYDLEGE